MFLFFSLPFSLTLNTFKFHKLHKHLGDTFLDLINITLTLL